MNKCPVTTTNVLNDHAGKMFAVLGWTSSSNKASVVSSGCEGIFVWMCQKDTGKPPETQGFGWRVKLCGSTGLSGFRLTLTWIRGHKSTHKSVQWETDGGRERTNDFVFVCVCLREAERERRTFTQLEWFSSAIVYLSYLRLHDSSINQVLLDKLYHDC